MTTPAYQRKRAGMISGLLQTSRRSASRLHRTALGWESGGLLLAGQERRGPCLGCVVDTLPDGGARESGELPR